MPNDGRTWTGTDFPKYASFDMRVLLASMVILASLNASSQQFRKSEFYRDASIRLIDQFVVEYANTSKQEIQNSVALWCGENFSDPKTAEKAEGDGFIIMKASLPFTYRGGIITASGQIRCETKFEFRDGRMRVTITDLPHMVMYGSVEIGQYSWMDSLEDYYDFDSPEWQRRGKRRFERDFLPKLMFTRNTFTQAIYNIPLSSEDDW